MTTLAFIDEMGLIGELKVLKIPVEGNPEVMFEEGNLIMDRAKAHLLSLVYDTTGSAVTDPIQSYKVGSGGVFNAGSAASVKPSDRKENDLYTAIVPGQNNQTYNPLNISHNANTQDPAYLSSSFPTEVTFSFNLTPNDLIGVSINEVGLFTAAEFMFNHKTFPTIYKTAEFSLQFTWTIKYN